MNISRGFGCGAAVAIGLCAVVATQAADTTRIDLRGYQGVPVRYGGDNKLLMRANVNGHAATLIIDTGASVSVMEARRAGPLGIKPVDPDSPYGEFTYLNGQPFRVGFVNSLKASDMDFGNGPIALFKSNTKNSFSGVRFGESRADGIFGTDILTRYKAAIDCRTENIFFKVDSSARSPLADAAVAQHFVRVPMREESNRAFTVPGSINGRPMRLLVDTGAFVTTFDRAAVKGMSLQQTRMAGVFADGVPRQISIGHLKQLMIGQFKVPAQSVAVAMLPDFALEHGDSHVGGILGMELLVANHAIIDFDSMSLFLR